MSGDSRQHGVRNLLLVLALVPCLFLVVLLGTVTTSETVNQKVCDPTGAAVAVDTTSVPQGPIAGYRREQLVNAAHVMAAAQKLGLTVRDQQIGVMTAMGESSLAVLDRGDSVGPDSRGLFQQRDNGAWGSYSDRMNPFISATNFFKKEMTVQGRESMEPTLVAHKVQSNADPYHYSRFWPAAQAVVQALGAVKTGPPGTAAGAPSQPAQTGGSRYNLGPVKPGTITVANTVGPKFGIKTVGGYRPPSAEKYDQSGHPAGLALDFMTNDIPDGKATGDRLAAYLQANAAALDVKYVMWYSRIWSVARADEGWRTLPDRGAPTQNHEDHVHLSLSGTGGSGVPTDATTSPAGCPPDGAAAGPGQAGPVGLKGWAAPAKGPITSPFGMRTHPVTGVHKLHSGTDFGAPCNAPIYAANAGTVIQAGPAQGYGNLLAIDHGQGVVSRYAHMPNDGRLVHIGDHVTAGQHIAKVGTTGYSTGCHLHFEIKQNGAFVDPGGFLKKVGVNTN
ncbi:M23 family metallopeptidase [Arsenicicoccus bolidensis]|uniref:M23 family metallopeptidase n=1 Tax=Arsenicicoccus bolidensis TaxID=229480 RepID=UPI00049228EF|nr:M23 family metallopeptidase [Arsenicicoccus bolidensis]